MSSRWRLLITLVSVGLSLYVVLTKPANLGLDLEGGTQVVLDLKPRAGQDLSGGDLANRTLEILRRRVDSLGVAEPNLEIAGDRRIIVELPGETDAENAVRVIGSTAQLTIHPVVSQVAAPSAATTTSTPDASTTATTAPPSPSTTSAGLGEQRSSDKVLGQEATTPSTATTTAPTVPTTTAPSTDATTAPQQNQEGAITVPDDSGTLYSLGPAVVKGDGIATATAEPPDAQHTSWYLLVEFKGEGAKAWTKLTAEEACKPQTDISRQSAFVLDNKIIEMSGPAENVACGTGITGNKTEIQGSFSQADVKRLALLIRGGALPVDVSVASTQVIGPELGQEAIDASKLAVAIGGALTILYIFGYYRGLGLMAGVALTCYGLISYAVLLGLGLTLTLPGIAGFVLAVAMAMDSNVLVYERTKEEFASGRSLRQSAQLGFKNALSAIIDSNATTFIAAATLFFVAVGEVKGFGVTLLIGTAVSIFVTMVVLRTLTTGLLSMNWARSRPGFLGMHVGAKFRKHMTENPPNLMKAAKYFTVISAGLTVAALVGIGVRHINYGIEFSGGRLIEYKTATPVDVDRARDEVEKLGIDHAVVQRADQDDTSVRLKTINNDEARQLDDLFKNLGGGTAERIQDTTIGPSFGAELKRKAVIGLIIGVGLQLAWVAYRFRWTFGIGAVIAMVHDALLVLGLFAWLQKPFDAVFLAALLTIIAFSVNDSVVVFDRIREQRRRRSSEGFARVVGDACAQTFPRTINISLSALFILAALFFVGGETLSDFSLALVIGVVTGVYSSVMIAAPIAVLLERWRPSLSRAVATSPSTGAARRKAAAASARASSEDPSPAGSDDTAPRPTATRPAPRPRKKGKKRR